MMLVVIIIGLRNQDFILLKEIILCNMGEWASLVLFWNFVTVFEYILVQKMLIWQK